MTGEDFDVAVLAMSARMAEARRAVELAGGGVRLALDWSEAETLAARVTGRPVLLLEAEGVGSDALSTALAGIVDVATTFDLRIVATLTSAQIDTVAAVLLGPGAQLLCDASLAELVTALAVAGRLTDENGLADRWREGEGERLRRLNDEVARIAGLLARLVRREPEGGESGGSDVADRHVAFGFAPPAVEADPQTVRQAIRARRMRDAFFGENLFEDPAWDMLLDLYAAHLEGGRVSVSSLCIAAAVAPTTALRWIGRMTEAGLFDREPDPHDRRRAFIVLSPKALRGMAGYVAAVRRAGASI